MTIGFPRIERIPKLSATDAAVHAELMPIPKNPIRGRIIRLVLRFIKKIDAGRGPINRRLSATNTFESHEVAASEISTAASVESPYPLPKARPTPRVC
ncbi:hypothetical protein MTP99_009827 [Tenebrio molitor]|nr:hypothetical protein MTP99_009827 [Tenebrio molitor]